MTCSACRYWVRLDHPDTEYAFFDDGNLISEDDPRSLIWGTCDRQATSDSPMFTNDGSDYFSALRTRDTFSCAAYEARDGS